MLWAIYGYSIAFTEGNAFFGGFDRLFLNGVDRRIPTAATFSKGVVIPEIHLLRLPDDLRGDHAPA